MNYESLTDEQLKAKKQELILMKNEQALLELKNTSLIPPSLNGKLALADQLAKSELVPVEYRGKPENIFIAFGFGEMLSISNPLSCLYSLYVIGGKPAPLANTMVAAVMSHPEFVNIERELVDLKEDFQKEINTGTSQNPHKIPRKFKNWKSITRITRKLKSGKEIVFEAFHTVKMSESRLYSFPEWQNSPEAMVEHRSDSKCCRKAFPEIFAGMHTPDEARDRVIEVQDGKGNIVNDMMPQEKKEIKIDIETEKEIVDNKPESKIEFTKAQTELINVAGSLGMDFETFDRNIFENNKKHINGLSDFECGLIIKAMQGGK